MFLTHPIKSYGFEYSLVRLEADQADTSKVSVPFLDGSYELFLAWVKAQVSETVAEEPIVSETVAEEPIVSETVAEEPTSRKRRA
jgi:hypothetical protein